MSNRKNCLSCGNMRSIIGRGLCTTCYQKHVVVPRSEGREPEFPSLNRGRIPAAIAALAAPAVREEERRFDLKPLKPEEVFWAHALWLAESMRLPVDDVPAMNGSAKTLRDHDPRFRVSNGEASTFTLEHLSIIAFGSKHELVGYFELMCKSYRLTDELRKTNMEIDALLSARAGLLSIESSPGATVEEEEGAFIGACSL